MLVINRREIISERNTQVVFSSTNIESGEEFIILRRKIYRYGCRILVK